jgi:hypothetical protein
MKIMKIAVISLAILFLSFSVSVNVSFAPTTSVYNGFSNYPYPLTTQAVDEVIELMEKHDLNVYRMSIRPSWTEESHPYRPNLIQHYLENTPSDWIIIIDANHLTNWWQQAFDHWETGIKPRLSQVCEDFPDTSRVWVELFNELDIGFTEYYERAQDLIDYVRDEGFTHTLVVNKLYTSGFGWKLLNDPLNKIYQGYHPYFQSSLDRANAFNSIQTAVNMGIKIINTEIGANSNNPDQWTQSQVNALQEFTENCAQIGVGNCIWTSWGTDWYYELLSYGYDFDNPAGSSSPPPPPPITLPFRDDFTADLSKWTIHSGAWSLVNGVLDGVSSGEGLIVAGDVDWVDYALRSRVQLMPDSSAMEVAFVVRFVDVNNFYWVGLGCWGHRVSISRMVNGAPEELAFAGDSAELTAKSYDVEVICAGDVLQFYVDGVLELEWVDPTHPAGAIGIRSYNSHIEVDYVEASESASPPSPPTKYWTLTITSQSSEGGITLPSGIITIEEGASQVVQANANPNYEFQYWMFDGEGNGTINPITISAQNADTSHTLTAVFALSLSTSHFEDGFESGDFSKWNGTRISSGETATVADVLPYQGSFHGRYTSNGGGEVEYAYSYRIIDEEEAYARGYFYIASGLPLENNDDRFYFIRLRAGRNSLAGVGIRRDGGRDKWVLYGRNSSGWVELIYANSSVIEMNCWYCVELHWKKHATHGIAETYVDGERILVIEDIDTARFGNVSEIRFGLTLALEVQKSLDVYSDCLAVSNTYIGPYHLITIPGDVDGDYDVDLYDVVKICFAYGSKKGEPEYEADYDVNCDDKIDLYDVIIACTHYGETL